MVNFNAFEKISKKYAIKDMPFLVGLKKLAKQKKIYQGLRILQNIPLTLEAVLKVEPLVLGGAEVTVSCIKSLQPNLEALAVLKEANIKVQLDHNFSNNYDVCLDCCAELSHLTPTLGTIELTQTGSNIYKNKKDLKAPVISIDDSSLKCLETTFGTGNGFLNAFFKYSTEDIYNKKFIIFGYGKVGSGIAHSLIKYTDSIVIVEPNNALLTIAKEKGLKVLNGKNKEELEAECQNAFCIITATGVKNLLSNVYNFNKKTFGTAYLTNMGAEDEYGENFEKTEVLFDKKPLNFSVQESTPMKYLDPILYAHNIAIEILQENKLSIGYRPLPPHYAEDILKKWCKFHQESFLDIRQF